jgi:hypothetical protein
MKLLLLSDHREITQDNKKLSIMNRIFEEIMNSYFGSLYTEDDIGECIFITKDGLIQPLYIYK